MDVAIVDHGRANISSVENMLRRVGVRARVAETPQEISGADRIVLPGIGSFDAVRERLTAAGFDEAIHEHAVVRQRPVLGVCVGMQVMVEGSAEGVLPGYGWIPGRLRKFEASPDLRVPHMGWSALKVSEGARLFSEPMDGWRAYFVHSYYLPAGGPFAAAECDHGGSFTAAVERDNLFGVQFHPEKSHSFGMAVFRAFLKV